MQKKLKELDLKKSLVVRRNGLGDLLLTYPLLKKMKIDCPDLEIDLLLDERNVDLLPFFSEPLWKRTYIFGKGNKYYALLKFLSEIKHLSYDLLLSAKPTYMKLMHVLLRFACASYQTMVMKRGTWIKNVSHPVYEEDIDPSLHQALQVLRIWDHKREHLDPKLFPKLHTLCKDREEFNARLNALGYQDRAKRHLLFNLCNNRKSSVLSFAQIQAMALECIWKEFGIILLDLPGDENRTKLHHQWLTELRKMFPNRPIYLIESDRLGMGLCAIEYCDLVVTGDGGFMHLAAALDTAQLALFGQTSIDRWHPLSAKALCLHHPQEVAKLDMHILLNSFEIVCRQVLHDEQ